MAKKLEEVKEQKLSELFVINQRSLNQLCLLLQYNLDVIFLQFHWQQKQLRLPGTQIDKVGFMLYARALCSAGGGESKGSETGWIKVRPEEDDLVTLQLEALLAEKSGLANENSNLVRENQCLHQVVEYHQLTSQDLSASFEQVVQGLCLDFSPPPRSTADEANGEDGDGDAAAAENKVSQALRSALFGFSASLDDGDH
ncbi:hypothetical protein EV1_008069 [Malus domestica]